MAGKKFRWVVVGKWNMCPTMSYVYVELETHDYAESCISRIDALQVDVRPIKNKLLSGSMSKSCVM